MKHVFFILLLGVAGSGSAFAQTSAVVSPSLGLEDFRRPMNCTLDTPCAMPSPALGLAGYSRLNSAGETDAATAARALLSSAALLPGPTARPESADVSSQAEVLHKL